MLINEVQGIYLLGLTQIHWRKTLHKKHEQRTTIMSTDRKANSVNREIVLQIEGAHCNWKRLTGLVSLLICLNGEIYSVYYNCFQAMKPMLSDCLWLIDNKVTHQCSQPPGNHCAPNFINMLDRTCKSWISRASRRAHQSCPVLGSLYFYSGRLGWCSQ